MRRFILILSILFLLCAARNATAQENPAKQKEVKARIVTCDGCNRRIIYLAKPKYPAYAKFRPGGTVKVEVLIDEKGFVESAKVVSGHPLFRAEALKAARKSKFEPVKVSGKFVKARSIIVYNFIP
jgi:TonB family protein